MSGAEQVTGGFAVDPAEAFAPTAGGGCCGAPAANTHVLQQAEAAPSPCCGTGAQASAEGSCCGASAKAEAVASGAGCCG
jgi:hypothetical protein